jgi:branched-chain amino acid transport system permease protein
VRDSLPYGATRGVSVLRLRVLAFALSGFMAGIAGGLYTQFNNSINPGVMGLTPMSLYVTMIVIGGMGTLMGPAVGTAILIVIDTMLADHPGVELTILGIALLVIVTFVPRGLVGEAQVAGRRFRGWLSEADRDAAGEEQPGEEER